MDITDIEDKLTPEQLIFYSKINNLLNCKMQFVGSISRKDFTLGKSDIDVQIFSENSQSDLLLLSHFLQENAVKFSSTFFTLLYNKHTVSGFKYTIEAPFESDILVYDIKNEPILTLQFNHHVNVPFIYLLIFKILKFCLKLKIISKETFRSIKSKIWNYYNNIDINEKQLKRMTDPEYKHFFTNSSDKTNLMHPSCYPKSIVFYQ